MKNSSLILDFESIDTASKYNQAAEIINFISSIQDQSLSADILKIKDKFQTHLKKFITKKGLN